MLAGREGVRSAPCGKICLELQSALPGERNENKLIPIPPSKCCFCFWSGVFIEVVDNEVVETEETKAVIAEVVA